MRCRGTRRRIAGYIYGDLSPGERTGFERHIERCGACRSALELTRRALEAMPKEPAPALSEGERAEMMRSVRRAIRTRAPVVEGARRWSWAAAVVLAAIGFGAGVWYTQSRGLTPRPPVARETGPPVRRAPAGPALAEVLRSEFAADEESQEGAEPQVVAVANVEVEFITHPMTHPTAAPLPAGDNDMRLMP